MLKKKDLTITKSIAFVNKNKKKVEDPHTDKLLQYLEAVISMDHVLDKTKNTAIHIAMSTVKDTAKGSFSDASLLNMYTKEGFNDSLELLYVFYINKMYPGLYTQAKSTPSVNEKLLKVKKYICDSLIKAWKAPSLTSFKNSNGEIRIRLKRKYNKKKK